MFKKTEAELTNQSLDLYQKKDYKKAEKICRQILKKNPTNNTVLINLGNILFLQKKYEEAIHCYQMAQDINPDSLLATVNMANTYLEMENYVQAEKYARLAINFDSQNYMALNVLGSSLLEQEHYDEALQVLQQALKLKKDDAWLYNYLSRCYQQKEMLTDAIQSGWRAVELAPQDEDHHINFGYMLYELSLDSQEKIIKEYARKWVQKFPDNKVAQHMGKAILKQEIPDRADAEYIREIFDIFASDFENVLNNLDYQTPQIMSKILAQIYGKDSHPKLHILDAGCGTGLCGNFLKPYAGFLSLEGVDLSSKMLAQAKMKKVYNRLYCNDIISFLNQKKSAYDLIVSADVLTYLGDLDSFFEKAQKALKKGGRILFSITENKEDDSNYILHSSGRYQHHLKYIHLLLKKFGFDIEKEEYHCLRKEALEEVKGYIISAIKA